MRLALSRRQFRLGFLQRRNRTCRRPPKTRGFRPRDTTSGPRRILRRYAEPAFLPGPAHLFPFLSFAARAVAARRYSFFVWSHAQLGVFAHPLGGRITPDVPRGGGKIYWSSGNQPGCV